MAAFQEGLRELLRRKPRCGSPRKTAARSQKVRQPWNCCRSSPGGTEFAAQRADRVPERYPVEEHLVARDQAVS
jgi:hypothetical protein